MSEKWQSGLGLTGNYELGEEDWAESMNENLQILNDLKIDGDGTGPIYVFATLGNVETSGILNALNGNNMVGVYLRALGVSAALSGMFEGKPNWLAKFLGDSKFELIEPKPWMVIQNGTYELDLAIFDPRMGDSNPDTGKPFGAWIPLPTPKPSQIPADWEETDEYSAAYIHNKPVITTPPPPPKVLGVDWVAYPSVIDPSIRGGSDLDITEAGFDKELNIWWAHYFGNAGHRFIISHDLQTFKVNVPDLEGSGWTFAGRKNGKFWMVQYGDVQMGFNYYPASCSVDGGIWEETRDIRSETLEPIPHIKHMADDGLSYSIELFSDNIARYYTKDISGNMAWNVYLNSTFGYGFVLLDDGKTKRKFIREVSGAAGSWKLRSIDTLQALDKPSDISNPPRVDVYGILYGRYKTGAKYITAVTNNGTDWIYLDGDVLTNKYYPDRTPSQGYVDVVYDPLKNLYIIKLPYSGEGDDGNLLTKDFINFFPIPATPFLSGIFSTVVVNGVVVKLDSDVMSGRSVAFDERNLTPIRINREHTGNKKLSDGSSAILVTDGVGTLVLFPHGIESGVYTPKYQILISKGLLTSGVPY